jgi:hypothetical protein
VRNITLGILLFLFLVCFVAIIVEELLLGGRRKRRLMREARARESRRALDNSTGNDEVQSNAHHPHH